ncbi:MAG TPA: lysophospholipid acyltransferase family protein [Burkholderiales bacterium]|nr:lysophospholipid acyltransferase family protein [Burkholderiales bacterium]
MIVFRSTFFLLLQSLLTVIFAVLALLVFPFPLSVRYRVITGWNRIVIWLARWVCGIRYQIVGLENLPGVPAIVMAKHQSAWETIALPILLPPMAIVLKRELLRIPFFGWGMAMLSPIAIDRGDGRAALRQIADQGRQRLADGMGILIFPEGTRIATGETGKYGIGGAWLATHVTSLVVPVAHNAGRVWPKNAFLKRPGLITVSIGPVIDPAGMKPDMLNQRVQEWIETEMLRLHEYETITTDR